MKTAIAIVVALGGLAAGWAPATAQHVEVKVPWSLWSTVHYICPPNLSCSGTGEGPTQKVREYATREACETDRPAYDREARKALQKNASVSLICSPIYPR